MKTAEIKQWNLQNETGKLAQNIVRNWLLGIRESNPAILDMFRDRELKPYRDLLPWSGEFAGKYLTSAYYVCLLYTSFSIHKTSSASKTKSHRMEGIKMKKYVMLIFFTLILIIGIFCIGKFSESSVVSVSLVKPESITAENSVSCTGTVSYTHLSICNYIPWQTA